MDALIPVDTAFGHVDGTIGRDGDAGGQNELAVAGTVGHRSLIIPYNECVKSSNQYFITEKTPLPSGPYSSLPFLFGCGIIPGGGREVPILYQLNRKSLGGIP